MKFALIIEGVSEHRIIKHIILKYFKGEDVVVNQIQPLIINNKQGNEGGWSEVLKYCQSDKLSDIFIENDFLVIQIDTDQSQNDPFSVSHTKEDNSVKSVEELTVEVIKKITDSIPANITATNKILLFAICVHTIECWLLPIYYTNNRKSNTTNCLFSINSEITKKNINAISPKDKNGYKARESYDSILKNWNSKKSITDSAKHNHGFKVFINSLATL